MKYLRLTKKQLAPTRKTHQILYLSSFLFLLPLLTACDSSESLLSNEEPAQTTSASALVTALDLNAEQIAIIEDLNTDNGLRKDPTRTWEAAKTLQETLTAEQKSALFEEANQKREERAQLRASARDQDQPRQRRGRNLNLTDEQKETLKAHREEIRTLRSQLREGSITQEAFDAALETHRNEMRTSLESVLTEEQLQRVDERKNRREARSATRTERRQNRQDERNEVLGLTQEQQEALAQIREEHRAAVQKIREEGRAAETDRTQIREQMKALQESLAEDYEDILTEEQRELVQIHKAIGTLMVADSASDGRGFRGRRGGRR